MGAFSQEDSPSVLSDAQMYVLDQISLDDSEMPSVQEEANAQLQSAAKQLCRICGKYPVKLHQICCCKGTCEGDIRAARRDSARQGKQTNESFQKLYRLGNQEFVQCMFFVREQARRRWQRLAPAPVRLDALLDDGKLQLLRRHGLQVVMVYQGGLDELEEVPIGTYQHH